MRHRVASGCCRHLSCMTFQNICDFKSAVQVEAETHEPAHATSSSGVKLGPRGPLLCADVEDAMWGSVGEKEAMEINVGQSDCEGQ